jgi:protein phosphatase
MIRVAEHVELTHTGHQRSTNEDSHLARSPVFVIADGMGGARAGEVASQIAVAHFADGLPDGAGPGERLTRAAHEANSEIHELSEADARRAGMGTTLTAAHVGPREVTFAHVGDSRAYLWRAGTLERITEDHSLVEELLRQGRLTEEEAEEHPQRSIITRALGPEPDVEVDTFTLEGADGDVLMICSDGLTSMVSEGAVAAILGDAPDIATAAERLVAAALDAGGRDNVTVVLIRLEEVAELDGGAQAPEDAQAGAVELPPTEVLATTPASAEAPAPAEPPAALDPPTSAALDPPALDPPTSEPLDPPTSDPPTSDPPAGTAAPTSDPPPTPTPPPTPGRSIRRRAPRMPRTPAARRRPRVRRRIAWASVVAAVVGVVARGAVLAGQSVYFIATADHGQVAVYNGIPYTLPGGVRLYTEYFVSGVTAAELSPLERHRLFNDELRSQASATKLVSQLELDRIAGQ